MAAIQLTIEAFLAAAKKRPVLDVRSPEEYSHAHIPGSHNLPLFSDEERKTIGTAYKQVSREDAIKIGLDAFGPKMRSLVEAVEAICKKSREKKVLVHCWRGGMRSAAIAWLLDLYGFEVGLLDGGYKAYRQWVIAHWTKPAPYRVLGGNTGAGKTLVLHELAERGVPVLDLEGIARHKGSAFGGLDRVPQPTQEMFENHLAAAIDAARAHPEQTIWVEEESQRIGDLNLPVAFWHHLNRQPMVFLDVAFEARLAHVIEGYQHHSTESLLNGIIRIKKRLGGLETKTAVNHLLEANHRECFRILLYYYDKLYQKAMANNQAERPSIQTIPLKDTNPITIAKLLLKNEP